MYQSIHSCCKKKKPVTFHHPTKDARIGAVLVLHFNMTGTGDKLFALLAIPTKISNNYIETLFA